jgi:cation transport ATPase
MILQHAVDVVTAAPKDPDTQNLADWLRGIFGPLFLVVIGIVAVFFLFTREITRFVQFIVLSVAVAIIFYYPGVISSVASGVVRALGLDTSDG